MRQLTRSAATLLAVVYLCGIVASQGRSTAPTFEVASVKPSQPDQPGTEVGRRPGGRLVAINATPVRLLRYAYAVQDYQVVGLPAWAAAERFDIAAKMAGEPARLAGPDDPLLVATRTLLAERFKLVTHRDTRELEATKAPVEVIVVDRIERPVADGGRVLRPVRR